LKLCSDYGVSGIVRLAKHAGSGQGRKGPETNNALIPGMNPRMAVTMAVPIGRLSHEGIQALSFDSPWWILRHLVEKQQKGKSNLKSEDQKLSTLIHYDQFKINRFLMSFMSWTTACLKNFLDIHEDVSHSSSDPSSTVPNSKGWEPT